MKIEDRHYIALNNKDDSIIDFELPPDVEEEGEIVNIIAYEDDKMKQMIYILLIILTGGFFYLFCRWELKMKIRTTMKKTRISNAHNVLIFCKDGTFELVPVKTEKLEKSSFVEEDLQNYKTFQYRLFKYYYDEKSQKMKPIFFHLTNYSNNKIHELYGQGIKDDKTSKTQKFLYGINSTEVPEKPLFTILIDEVLSPFTIFQVFSCALWFADRYEIYAGIIVFVTVVSVVLTLKEAKDNMRNLREMSYFETKVKVYRGLLEKVLHPETNPMLLSKVSENLEQKKQILSSFDLVPGDVIEVPENELMPCDIILLNGTCIMNESMLTGESIPIVKTSLPYNNLDFNPNDENKSSVLYSGTKCIESRYYMKGKIPVLGLVYQTGFNTMKGQLVRSILFPKSTNFNFYKDALKFICSIAMISVVGLVYTIVMFVKEGAETKDIILKCLDMITVTIPPALPTCMSIGIGFALTRLKKKNIFCISPPKINISGKVNIMCFDKTGTLTEEGLDTFGVRAVCFDSIKNRVKFSPIQKKPYFLFDDLEMVNRTPKELPSVIQESRKARSQLLLEVLACCHSLTSVNGQLIGDPLDIKMFEWSNWIMEDNNENKFDELILAVVKAKQEEEKLDFENLRKSLINNNLPDQIGIIRRFDFSSKLQRMSVIVRNLNDDKFRVYVKGSPEKMREICKAETIPKEFHKVLDFYSRNGYRVLGCASRTLKISFRNIDKIERNDVECNLTFLGFLIMENKLKPITSEIISNLQQANIRTIMVTGDNVLTAISVARQCGLVNPRQRIYFGDLNEQKAGKKTKLLWKDFDFSDHSLDPDTLVPEKRVEEEDIDFLESDNEEEKKEDEVEELTRKLQDQDKKSVNTQQPKPPGQGKKSQSLVFSVNNAVADTGKSHFYRSMDQNRTIDLEKNYPEGKIEKLPTVQDLQIIEDQNPPWLHLENNSYVLAISGKAFSYMLEEKSKGSERIFKRMLENAQIFARMKPNEKTVLIQSLQKHAYHGIVGMCGDGANDCGALKAADVGVSISEAEASIAAPFTSKTQNISCVPELLKEGRCALTTSFQCFKYMALYSMIQFGGVTVLHGALSNFSNFEYLYVDMIVIFPLAIFMGYTEPCPHLSKYMPSSNLISFPVLSSVIGQIIIQIGFQVGIYIYTVEKLSSSETCINLHKNAESMDEYWDCFENANIFLFANFQYLATVFAFSIGPPFRKHFYTNPYFTTIFGILIALCVLLVFIAPSGLRSFLSLHTLDFEWKMSVFIAVVINFFVTYLYEKIVVSKLSLIWKKRKEKERVANDLQENEMQLGKQTMLPKNEFNNNA